MDKITVIVPVYNTEKYLSRCIESILQQTHKDLEVILINDGSSDKSGLICDEYAKFDKRVKVIHQTNKGQSSARNKGLEIATGKYIGFVDSDDWIKRDMYEYLIKALKDNDCDIANIDYILVNDERLINQSEESIKIYKNEEILYEYLLEGTIRGSYSFCRNIYKKELFKDVRFPEGKINEDIVTNYKVLANARKMCKSNYIGYYYYQDNNSTTRGGLKSRDFDLIDISKELLDIAKATKNKRIVYLAEVKLARAYFSLLSKIAMYGIEDSLINESKIVKELTYKLRENYFFLLRSPMKKSRKIAMTLICLNIKLLSIPLNIYKRITLLNKGI